MLLAGDLAPRHVGHTVRVSETTVGRLDAIGRPVFGLMPVTVDGARYTLWPDALVDVTFDPAARTADRRRERVVMTIDDFASRAEP